VCDRLWVVGGGQAAPFDGGYRAWRAAIAGGWTVAGAIEIESKRLRPGRASGGATSGDRAGHARRAGRAGCAPAARPAAVESAGGGSSAPTAMRAPGRRSGRAAKLSKDAYKRQRTSLDAELTRLGLRKSHLELAMADPTVAANFVELRRVTSELADVEAALLEAEDAWLELEERAP
jgi:hypothetical protein